MMKRHVSCLFAMPVLISLTTLGFVGSAWGQCVQTTTANDPGASTVLLVDGTQSCSKISGQTTGCSVKGGSGECTFTTKDGKSITISSTADPKNGLSWKITSPLQNPIKVDTALLGGAQAGNACVYVYSQEAISGQGLGFKTNNTFQNVQYAEFCTDGKNQQPDSMLGNLPSCNDITLDGTMIGCPLSATEYRFIISLNPNKPDLGPVACTCNTTFKQCNPNEQSASKGPISCLPKNDGLQAVPIHWEAFNDGTTVCRTIGGTRTCWTQ